MEIYKINDKAIIAPLFEGWEETMIWSCLQDCMGDAYADDPNAPRSAQILIGDFSFLSGTPMPELIGNLPDCARGALLVPQSKLWEASIESVWGQVAIRMERYAFRKDTTFDRARLETFAASLPSGFVLSPIDRIHYGQIMALDWARDLCRQFQSAQDFAARGRGVVALEGNEVVAGASSYTVYRTGIEIEIDTREDRRRLGLARACGAQLILDCLDRGLYPSWDAHNAASAALAEQLGYESSGVYTAYEVCS